MFTINIDLSQLNQLTDLGPTLKKIAKEAGDELSKMVVAKAKEKAAEKLHTRRKMYQDGLDWKPAGENTWMIILSGKVRWIDDGQTAFDMLKGLLNSPKAKSGKNGRYIVVPFDGAGPMKGGRIQGANKVGRTSAEQDLMNAVKQELNARNIPFDKIEKDSNGNDRTGKLHSFNIMNAPKKQDDGLGQRRGPVGEVMQGAKEMGQKSGTPFLQGVSIYQNKDREGKTQRKILTFRVATESKGGAKRWEHPGNAAVNILEESVKEALELWTKEVEPALMAKAISELTS